MAIATAPSSPDGGSWHKHEHRLRTPASKSITDSPCSQEHLILPARHLCCCTVDCCAVSFQLNKIRRDSRVRWSVLTQRRAPVSEALTRAYQSG